MTESKAPESEANPGQRRPRNQALILVGVFFGPLLLAFALYYGGHYFGLNLRPAGSTNRGELIHPARPLPQVELDTTDGTKLAAQGMHGKWNLVYVGDGQCDARCREALVLMRQTRLALNDDMTRVQRIFLATANCCDDQYLTTEHVGLITAKADNAAGQQLLASFPDGAATATTGRIYIVDPLGNLMMSYDAQAPRKGLLEDLKKLLKLSHIG